MLFRARLSAIAASTASAAAQHSAAAASASVSGSATAAAVSATSAAAAPSLPAPAVAAFSSVDFALPAPAPASSSLSQNPPLTLSTSSRATHHQYTTTSSSSSSTSSSSSASSSHTLSHTRPSASSVGAVLTAAPRRGFASDTARLHASSMSRRRIEQSFDERRQMQRRLRPDAATTSAIAAVAAAAAATDGAGAGATDTDPHADAAKRSQSRSQQGATTNRRKRPLTNGNSSGSGSGSGSGDSSDAAGAAAAAGGGPGVPLPAPVDSAFLRELEEAAMRGDVATSATLLHQLVLRGYRPSPFAFNLHLRALVSRRLFDAVPAALEQMAAQGAAPDAVTVNTVLSGLAAEREWERFDAFRDAVALHTTGAGATGVAADTGVALSAASYAILAHACVTRGDPAGARATLARMTAAGVQPTTQTTNVLLASFVAEGDMTRARAVFQRMLATVPDDSDKRFPAERKSGSGPVLRPSEHTFTTLGRGLIDSGALGDAIALLPMYTRHVRQPSPALYTLLIFGCAAAGGPALVAGARIADALLNAARPNLRAMMHNTRARKLRKLVLTAQEHAHAQLHVQTAAAHALRQDSSSSSASSAFSHTALPQLAEAGVKALHSQLNREFDSAPASNAEAAAAASAASVAVTQAYDQAKARADPDRALPGAAGSGFGFGLDQPSRAGAGAGMQTGALTAESVLELLARGLDEADYSSNNDFDLDALSFGTFASSGTLGQHKSKSEHQ